MCLLFPFHRHLETIENDSNLHSHYKADIFWTSFYNKFASQIFTYQQNHIGMIGGQIWFQLGKDAHSIHHAPSTNTLYHQFGGVYKNLKEPMTLFHYKFLDLKKIVKELEK